MGCSSCAEKRRAFKRALKRGEIVRATSIAAKGAAQILRDVVAPPRRKRPKGS